MSFFTRPGLLTRSSRSSISSRRASSSRTRLRMYSLLMLRRRISATYSAWIWSMPKPIIRLGTTSASSSVSRMMRMALSMSSRIRLRPLRRWSLSRFLFRVKYTRRRTHSVRQEHHSSSRERTPMTRGVPATRTLKLQLTASWRVVDRKSLAMSFSGSTPRLRSMASFRPLRSVSSRMSLTSLSLPALMSSETLSMMFSVVVV